MKLKTISTSCPVAHVMQKEKPHYTAGKQNGAMVPVHKNMERHIQQFLTSSAYYTCIFFSIPPPPNYYIKHGFHCSSQLTLKHFRQLIT
jgi:hypothetical protein